MPLGGLQGQEEDRTEGVARRERGVLGHQGGKYVVARWLA